MKKIFILLSFVLLFMVGCTSASPTISTLERSQMRTKTMDGNYDIAFRSLMTIMENQGYTIENTDYNTGLIRATATRDATSSAQKFWLGQTGVTTVAVSATVRKYTADRTKVRINVRQESDISTSGYYGSNTSKNANEIDDPETYKRFFDELRTEIARAKAMK